MKVWIYLFKIGYFNSKIIQIYSHFHFHLRQHASVLFFFFGQQHPSEFNPNTLPPNTIINSITCPKLKVQPIIHNTGQQNQRKLNQLNHNLISTN